MWPYPKVVAHRGGGILAPENTLAAMRCGLRYGFHAVEFDVMLAADGIPILMHDAQFGRTVPGTGKVADFTALQLSGMDAGSWFGPEFAGERVPTYREAADFCRVNAIWMNVEIKPAPGFERQTGAAVAALSRTFFAAELASAAGPPLLPLFSSFSFDALLAAKDAVPAIPRGYLVDRIPADWRNSLEALGAVALHVNHKHLCAERAAEVKSAGYGLFCYTVNDPVRVRELLSWGVDAFCTDRLDLIGPEIR
ncbi:MAG TPA: glycerophosphodiester phosphodiesterase [Burkholderiaceae bacterium]|nr:glycerophosphodiester phosphodiesterase [Burkholderiaceae bacterium]